MDGPRREVVQRGNEISYFNRDLNRSRLMAITLLILYHRHLYRFQTPFSLLRLYLRRAPRIADRLCEVIRVVARDGTRTATSCGWTPNRNYRCGLISLSRW